jgi:nucleotide-binding universal stress UspA family protein
MHIKRILVPTDFSTASRAAIEPARAMSRKFGATLELIHVCEDPPLMGPDIAVTVANESLTLHEVLKREADREMAELLADVREDGVDVQGRVVFGSAWRTLTDIIVSEFYDLVVIATHGRRGFDRLFLGSVTEKVVRHSTCPVLVIHASPTTTTP